MVGNNHSLNEQKTPPSDEGPGDHLAHHFDTPHQQYASAKLGMWVFLVTEILFFSGLFVAYAVYRANHPEIFVYAHQYLDKTLGGINTVVLITSSLTMALAVRYAQLGNQKMLVGMLVATLIGAFGFLGIKSIEYEHKWKHGLLWGQHYDPDSHGDHGEHGEDHALESEAESELESEIESEIAAESETEIEREVAGEIERSNIAPSEKGPSGLAAPVEDTGPAWLVQPGQGDHGDAESPDNVHIFFGIYFAMTGLHGLHVIIGIGLILWLTIRAIRGHFGRRYFTPVDNVGLYWHLVDLIWIFLFPLLYLIH